MKMTRNLTAYVLSLVAAVMTAATAWGSPKTVTVTGEATYYDNGHHSKVECMRLAAEQARIDALAREFGTIVTQDIVQTDRIRTGRETNDLLAVSMTEVKGEWLGDSAEPKYEFSYDKDQNMVVKCTVRGTARAITNEAIAFETSALRNGIHSANADTRFRDGDDMYLYFLGSSDGYLTVWLEDESRTVYNLLPYPRDPKSEVKVKRYQEYTFFNAALGKGMFGPEEELVLTAPDEVEYNRLYVVFSPNPYSRPAMNADGGLPSMPSDEFSKWLMRARRNDPKMGVKSINIEISPKR